jgi:Uma2 family endonuclease
MSSAEKFEPTYSVDDYLQWKGDWELWNGRAVAMSPAPSPKHQLVASTLTALLFNALHGAKECDHCKVLSETDWRVSGKTVVRPDVLVTCNVLPEKYIEHPPELVAEVLSPSTASKDRTAKKSLYCEQGVKYYLLIDTEISKVEMLELKDGEYVTQASGKIGFELSHGFRFEIDSELVFSG